MMVENHNRKMTLPLLDQCTELIRSLAAAVGTDKVTFPDRFNARQTEVPPVFLVLCSPKG